MPFGLAGYLAENSRGTAMTCIVRTMWTLETESALFDLVPVYRAFLLQYPHIRLIVAANTEKELGILREAGIETALMNHNMFVDENIFRPMPAVARRYDAVYNANFSSFKRRELASEIESCIHIGYFSDASMRGDAVPHFEAVKAEFPHHVFANEVKNGNFQRVPVAEVNAILAEAHVGLCLSAVEGPMVACMEYLFAGLPVVTTANIGGRDRYLSPEVSITAEANPRDIRMAVEALKARAIPPHAVRDITMKLVQEDRAGFNSYIDGLREGYRPIVTNDRRFHFHYVNNLHHARPVAEFCRELGFPLDFIGAPPSILDLLAAGLDEDASSS
jgi:hypothetical protein